jgi:RHS repeat-associated protein
MRPHIRPSAPSWLRGLVASSDPRATTARAGTPSRTRAAPPTAVRVGRSSPPNATNSVHVPLLSSSVSNSPSRSAGWHGQAGPFQPARAASRRRPALVRARTLFSLAAITLTAAWLAAPPSPLAAQVGGGGGTTTRSPEAGMPNDWEAGLPVNPFTTVNLYNGNACTLIHFVSYDPVGPAVSFSLIHNAATAAAGSGPSAPWGFDISPGWTISYGSWIDRQDASNKATLIEDDGNEWVFALSSGNYTAPPGRFDRMVLTSSTTFTVTAPDQTVRTYTQIGSTTQYRLASITDSSGNVASVAYNSTSGALETIRSAADGLSGVGNHRLTLESGTISGITGTRLISVTDVIGRAWTLEYDTASPHRLKKINFPTDSVVPASHLEFTYDSSSRITAIKDRAQTTASTDRWELAYTSGKVTLGKDPQVTESGTSYRLQRSIAYSGSKMDGYWRTTVTDRRGKNWQFDFDDSANLARTADPLGLAASPKYYKTYTHDSSHNVLTSTNELGKTWTATYGAVGNLLTFTGPAIAASSGAQQVWTLTWEQPDATNRPNFWRMTQISDPASHWTQYQHASSLDPTLVTKVVEIPDGVSGSASNSNGETTIEHYDSGTANARGQLKLVVDANGVNHKFWYNEWGYQEAMKEGGILSTGPGDPVGGVDMNCGTDAAGRSTSASNDSGSSTDSPSADDTNASEGCAIPVGSPARFGNVPSPEWGAAIQCLTSATYNLRQQPLAIKKGCGADLEVRPNASGFETQRRHECDYDALGRPVRAKLISDIDDTSPGTVERESWFSYLKSGNLPEPAGVTMLTGPDGQSTSTAYDDLGRVHTMTGGTAGDMQTEVHYDQAGRVDWVRHGLLPDGTKTYYTHDEVDRVTEIRTESLGGVVRLQTIYTWNMNNTVSSRTELDNFAGMNSGTTFTYDARDRLIEETRAQGTTTVYDITYGYDQLGNRLTKADSVSLKSTEYFYDTVSANREPSHPTLNNRLMRYEEKINGTLVRTVRYTYYKSGDVSNIAIKDHYVNSTQTPGNQSDYDWVHDLALYYFTNGSLRLALSDKWKLDSQGDPDGDTYVPLTAREFRYDSPRARYLSADYNCNGSALQANWTLTDGAVRYTDYIGETPYSDAAITADGSGGHSFAQSTRYFDLDGAQSLDSSGSVTSTCYLHGDLIESNVLKTDAGGAAVASTAYSAFGEPVPASTASPDAHNPSTLSSRYEYAGGHGYEAGMLSRAGANSTLATVSLAHVGARWYDAAIGRFLQRDPLGMYGGMNVYAYVHNSPLSAADPTGLIEMDPKQLRQLWKDIQTILEIASRWSNLHWGLGPIFQRICALATTLAKMVSKFIPDGPPIIFVAIMIHECIEAAYAAQPDVNKWLDDAADRAWENRVRLSQRGVRGGGLRSGGRGEIARGEERSDPPRAPQTFLLPNRTEYVRTRFVTRKARRYPLEPTLVTEQT